MKKIYLFLALCLMSVMNARANSQELTVYPGTATSNMVPIALNYCDSWTESQHIIRSSLLTKMTGSQILGLQYYTTATSAFTSRASIELVMWEVDPSITTLSGFLNYGQPNVTYNGKVDFIQDDGQICATILFDTPFEYHGGSLVIDTHNPNQSWSDNVVFYGQVQQSTAWAGYNSEVAAVYGSKQNFAPMITFYYEDTREALTYFRLSGFDASGIQVGTTWTESLCKSIANAIKPVGNAPWHVVADEAYLMVNDEELGWQELVEYGTKLKTGTYYYRVTIAINDDKTNSYRIPDFSEGDITVVVDGESWDAGARNSTYGYFEIESPMLDVHGQGIENTNANANANAAKIIRDGQLYIIRGDKTFNAQGAEMK